MEENEVFIENFLNCKRVEGCAKSTMKYYKSILKDINKNISKKITNLTTDDIRQFLIILKDDRKISNISLDNVRRVLNSFFCWCEDEDLINKSPMRKIHKVKTEKIIKEAYTEEDIKKILASCKTIRDKTLINFMLATGVRVGEIVSLDREDINFETKEIKVFGKGSKERIVYFNNKTAKYLQRYFKSRKDDNPALFVTERAPFLRLTKASIGSKMRKLGKKAGVENVHPHRFRRTFATMAIDKGMPIEQVQTLLGHEEIKTTQRYAMVKQKNVKIGYKKFME